jgi:hypothetical protein
MPYLQTRAPAPAGARGLSVGLWEDLPIELVILVVLLSWMIAFGAAAATAAVRLDRPAPAWAVLGAILGPLALVVLRRAPPGLCRACGSPTRGWLNVCWWCGQDVNLGASTTASANAKSTATWSAGRLPLRRDAAPPNEALRLRQASGSAGSTTARAAMPPRKSEPVDREWRARTPPAPAIVSEQSFEMLGERPETIKSMDRRLRVAASIAPVPLTSPPETTATHILATAVYVTGNTNLQPGHRYGIAIRQSRLEILGPTDIDPDVVAFNSPIGGMGAQSMGGRLILSTPQGLALAFMAVSGPATSELASIILDEARREAD